MRRLAVSWGLLLTTLSGCTTDAGPQPRGSTPEVSASVGTSPSPSPAPIQHPFSLDRVMQMTRHMSVEIGIRNAGSPGEDAAAEYLQKMMHESGLEVRTQEFKRSDGGSSVNVIARIPGADYSKGYVVVGGHYDTTKNSPGADDNATGTATVVELGSSLSKDARVPVEFVAFAAEERNPATRGALEGSAAYVAQLADAGAVKAMVSVDMIGRGSSHALVGDRRRPDGLDDEIEKSAIEVGVPVHKMEMGEISDHVSFTKVGVPGVLVWQGTRGDKDTPRDVFEKVEAAAVNRGGALLLRWIENRFSVRA